MKRVKSLIELRKAGPVQIRLLLNGGMYSCYVVSWSQRRQQWYVWSLVDDSEQWMTEAELKTNTLIVKGIKRKAVYYENQGE